MVQSIRKDGSPPTTKDRGYPNRILRHHEKEKVKVTNSLYGMDEALKEI